MLLSQEQTEYPVYYTISRQEKNKIGNRAVFNQVDYELSSKLLETNSNGEKIFEIEIINYKQSYKEGFYGWVKDLIPLKQRLLLQFNKDGFIDKVLNMQDIQKIWSSLKGDLTWKHRGKRHYKNLIRNLNSLIQDKERYTDSLRYAFPYDMLFQNFYNKNSESLQTSHFKIPNFFIANLPIKTKQEIDSMSIDKQEVIIKETGKLDTSKFNQERFDLAIKQIQLDVQSRSEININYIKKAEIDISNGWVNQGFSYVSATVPGFIFREEISEVKLRKDNNHVR